MRLKIEVWEMRKKMEWAIDVKATRARECIDAVNVFINNFKKEDLPVKKKLN